jgi:hypothetical protein
MNGGYGGGMGMGGMGMGGMGMGGMGGGMGMGGMGMMNQQQPQADPNDPAQQAAMEE